MARIVCGAFTTFNLSTHLDAQTYDLYKLRELISDPNYTAATPKITLDTNGNVGIGVIPTWGAGSAKTLQIGAGFFSGYDDAAANQQAEIAVNCYQSSLGVYNRLRAQPALLYKSYTSIGNQWSYAGTGGIGSVITWLNALLIDMNGNVVVNGAGGLGYATGSGGTVTQATSKTTAVTLNKTNGQVVMNAAALAAGVSVGFIVTNSAVAATDVVVLSLTNGSVATPGAYSISAHPAAGLFSVYVRNTSAGSLSEALAINFAVIKAVTA